jgi:hypothetical protein
MSKLAREPVQYGYELASVRPGRGISTDGPYWRNDHFDKPRAEALAKEIQALFCDRQPVGNWAVYSRLRSLGFDHHEITQKGRGREDRVLKEADLRKERLRKTYMEALLA